MTPLIWQSSNGIETAIGVGGFEYALERDASDRYWELVIRWKTDSYICQFTGDSCLTTNSLKLVAQSHHASIQSAIAEAIEAIAVEVHANLIQQIKELEGVEDQLSTERAKSKQAIPPPLSCRFEGGEGSMNQYTGGEPQVHTCPICKGVHTTIHFCPGEPETTFNYRCARCGHIQTYGIQVNLDFFRCSECGSTALSLLPAPNLGAGLSNSGVEGHAATCAGSETACSDTSATHSRTETQAVQSGNQAPAVATGKPQEERGLGYELNVIYGKEMTAIPNSGLPRHLWRRTCLLTVAEHARRPLREALAEIEALAKRLNCACVDPMQIAIGMGEVEGIAYRALAASKHGEGK